MTKLTMILLAALLGVGAAASRPAEPQDRTIKLWYRIPGEDPLSIKFRSALAARLQKDKQFKVVSNADDADLKIESPSRTVDWDTLGGRMVVIYILSVEGNGKQLRLSGVCYASDMDKCARDLIGRTKHYSFGL